MHSCVYGWGFLNVQYIGGERPDDGRERVNW